MAYILGAAFALVLTLVLAKLFGFGHHNDRVVCYLRLAFELVPVAGVMGLLLAAAFLQSGDARQMLYGYLGVRAIALVLEFLAWRQAWR